MSGFTLEEIRVFALFGYLNPVIPLQPGGVTFIHGPNGCGKTTILRFIAAIFDWEPTTLFEVPFKSIEIVDSDGSVFYVDKSTKRAGDPERTTPVLMFGIRDSSNEPYELYRDSQGARIPLSELEEFLPFLSRVGPREWLDRTTGQRLEYHEVIERYADRLPHMSHPSRKNRPPWLTEYVKQINLHFIKTQRLLKVDQPSLRRSRPEDISVSDVIQLHSTELKEIISKKLAEQAVLSQVHEHSFPERLLTLSKHDYVSESDIRESYAATEEKIQRLIQAGLIDKQENISLPGQTLEETERRVLSLYLQDVNKKLSVFDDLQKKIEAFLGIVGHKLKTKRFTVTRNDGFRIESVRRPGFLLSPTQLSSGEQHQIVLFYELVFKAERNAFFLVDEPEISLHVDWQRQFISDIRKIATLGDRHFLIATHSPQIIGNFRDLAVALDDGILKDV